MQFLSQLKSHAGRQVGSLSKVEKWHLLGQKGSGSIAHQDHCGFWTWIKVEKGRNLWLICQLSNDDQEKFAKYGPTFTGGKWFYTWLEAGDILIMPPGTVHAVFTPVDTLCTGGNGWSKAHMGDTMRSIAFEKMHPRVTNDKPVPQLNGLLQEASRGMGDEDSDAEFGGEERKREFREYRKVRISNISAVLQQLYS
ncbi:hypothetical protein FGG08_003704 [Glutinoglossum americanum]|uniref:JmjC domain-containing protein n=1 Tax=Glutinoglossum americanum TaxID=1670608 RepID=A0A9P8I6P1_9PEZI|nr:hypothetical protein FGG08_003704 [Glutinoglossum americanum]